MSFDCFTVIVEWSNLDKSLSKEKEGLILNAAKSRFAAYGYSKVTMDEIAEDIGMAKASLYYYFPTKEAIFRSVVLYEQEDFLLSIKKAFERLNSSGEKLLEYMRRRLKLIERLSNLSHAHQQTWYDIKPIFKDLFMSFIQHELHLITQIMQEGKKSGEFQVEHPQKMALMILHVLQGLHLRFFRVYDQQISNESDRVAFEQEVLLFANTVLTGVRKIK